MSIQKRIQQGFLRMPTSKQAILIASGAMMLSPLFPWFEFQKKAGPLTVWLGYQGPFFLTAIVGSAMGAYLFYKLFTPLLGQAFFKGGEQCGPHAMIAGLVQSLLLIFAMSSYFHPLFIEGFLTKSPGTGLFISASSAVLLLGAGWAAHRREKEGLDASWMDFELENHKPESYQEPFQEPYQEPSSAFRAPAFQAPEPVMEPSPPNHQFRTESRFSQRHRSLHDTLDSQKPAPVQENIADSHGVDPLTLDPKTRYKLMKQRERIAQESSSTYGSANYWG